ncbi:hypothetical protein K469DRAFT_602996, partial [Zopfia rhizophila CBS 207.26]
HSNKRLYKYSECGSSFKRLNTSKQHQATHERPYECKICGKRFSRIDYVQKHYFTHMKILGSRRKI